MAKFKITLSALPDFKLPVQFVMPNGDEAEVVFTVKHVSADALQEMFKGETSNEGFITKLAKGWDLEEEFSAENVKELVGLFMGIAPAFVDAYMKALAGQRVKN